MELRVLVSPLTKGAYFADHLAVARAELRVLTGGAVVEVERVGPLEFLRVTLEPDQIPGVARASSVQGLFDVAGEGLRPLTTHANFALPEELVFGTKYAGKTNELVTQLGINLALRFCRSSAPPKTLLDPMAGKGTTLLWALRYGLNARGLEIDAGAREALHRHVKRQTKLHRLKHRHHEGFVGPRNRGGRGKFVEYTLGERTLQLITGDSRDAIVLLGRQRFDMLVTDLPYGVQFKSGARQRNPLETLQACAPGWVSSVRPGGSLVLIFNRYQPNRDALAEVFTAQGCHLEPFEAPHRMSESIVRDLLVFTRPFARSRPT